MTLEEAIKTRDALREKLDFVSSQLADIDSHRSELAFAANTGDADAKRSIIALNSKRHDRQNEAEELGIALREADRLIGIAEEEKQAAADAEKARRALEIGQEIEKRASKLDKLLGNVCQESLGIEALFRELNYAIGLSHPNLHQLNSFGARAVTAAFMRSAFKQEHLAPRERYTFAQLAEGWRATITLWAEQRLPQKEEEAA
jgi:hypothetical protein